MSIMRASGAIRRITALQMATESLAVPKSVMNTMVGRGALFAESCSWFELRSQPLTAAVRRKRRAFQDRLREDRTLASRANLLLALPRFKEFLRFNDRARWRSRVMREFLLR